MLSRARQPSVYAGVMVGTEIVAVGRTVLDDDWAGVFGMATLPHARGRQAARSVLTALAEWAIAHATENLHLQVTCENDAALRLYERAGFAEVCRFHYRTPEWSSETANGLAVTTKCPARQVGCAR